eukprot:1803673-Karenia_brevis.AAC.1
MSVGRKTARAALSGRTPMMSHSIHGMRGRQPVIASASHRTSAGAAQVPKPPTVTPWEPTSLS